MSEESQKEDPFRRLVLHHERIDWENLKVPKGFDSEADYITSELMGPCDYWDLPEFAEMADREAFHEIERQILFDARRPNWSGTSKYGKTYYQHMLTLGKLMFPDTDITPALADVVMFFCMSVGEGRRKILNLIGSQNAGKSFGSCFLAFVLMYVDPEYTNVFVSNPYDKSSDSQEWGTILELYWQMVDYHPAERQAPRVVMRKSKRDEDKPVSALFPKATVYADRYIILVPDLPKAGRMELRGVKNEGKYRGTKAPGKDVSRGVILMIVGEVNLIENFAFIDMTDNLKSQPGFIAVTSQNFKDPEDQGGRLAEPSGLYGGPSTFDDLDIEEDLWWHSARSSVTLRLDGHKSPNILLGRDIYPKLFTLENLRIQKEAGVDSPSYYSQVRSFPVRGDENNSVLSRSKVSASRHKDSYFTFISQPTRVAFCDPAFGGRDSAMWGYAEFGTAIVTDGDGIEQRQEIIVFKDFFKKLKLVKGAWFPGDNDYWKVRMEKANIPMQDYAPGAELSYEDQIAIQCKEHCLENHIPLTNFGYDFSMRYDIVSSIMRMMGHHTVGFDYNQGPEGVMIQNVKQNSLDCCKNRNTELALLAADTFLTRQVRGGSFIETAITQLTRTLCQTVNKKYVAEGKKEYKARWVSSPDHRDVLQGICGMAVKRGFRQASVGRTQGGAKSVWSELNSRGIGKSKIVKRI